MEQAQPPAGIGASSPPTTTAEDMEHRFMQPSSPATHSRHDLLQHHQHSFCFSYRLSFGAMVVCLCFGVHGERERSKRVCSACAVRMIASRSRDVTAIPLRALVHTSDMPSVWFCTTPINLKQSTKPTNSH